jgi:hypothetical protein
MSTITFEKNYSFNNIMEKLLADKYTRKELYAVLQDYKKENCPPISKLKKVDIIKMIKELRLTDKPKKMEKKKPTKKKEKKPTKKKEKKTIKIKEVKKPTKKKEKKTIKIKIVKKPKKEEKEKEEKKELEFIKD